GAAASISDRERRGVWAPQLQAQPQPGAVGLQMALLGAQDSVEEPALDRHVVMEVLEVCERLDGAAGVGRDRGRGRGREGTAPRLAQSVDGQESGDSAASGYVR